MRFTVREEPIIKSTVYAVICLCLLLFSYSFLPSLGLLKNTPILLIAAVSSLALFEDVRYASFFALIFSVIETLINGTNTLIFPLFYTAFAIACTWLFESFFVKNFLAWSCYTAGGLAIHSVLSLFAPVGNWGITAPAIVLDQTLPTFVLSAVFSLPLFWLFRFVKKKTDKN
ncbi:MAG: hypothetical protein IJN48_06495 [Clostridia bacterium]|nr:hypothetical protein [Clostridia bacterium]